MNLNQLLKANVEECGNVEYVPSKRLKDENGNLQVWVLRPLTTKEVDALIKKNTTKKYHKRTGLSLGEEINNTGLLDDMVLASLVDPSREMLEMAELQDSWGVFTPIELLKALLNPGEYTDLTAKVQEISGFEVTATENLVAEAKKNLTEEIQSI